VGPGGGTLARAPHVLPRRRPGVLRDEHRRVVCQLAQRRLPGPRTGTGRDALVCEIQDDVGTALPNLAADRGRPNLAADADAHTKRTYTKMAVLLVEASTTHGERLSG